MLKLDDISIRRGSTLILDHCSASIFPGWKTGLVGANGSGKTSLLNVLLDRIPADGGVLTRPQGWRIACMEQEVSSSDRSAIEYVLDGDQELRTIEQKIAAAELQDPDRLPDLYERLEDIDGYSARSRAGALLSGLGFSSDQHSRSVAMFSGGWRVRLSLARALMCRSDLLLLDEPTNHLDLDAIIWLADWLGQYRGTLLLVSHDRDFLDDVIDHVAWLDNASLEVFRGNYSSFEEQRAVQLEVRQSTFVSQSRRIEQLQNFVDRFRAKATKARQAQSRLKALDKMIRILPVHETSPFTFTIPEAEKTSDPLLILRDANLGYGSQTVVNMVNLSLRPGDRIGLLGPNGSGKSTLIRSIAKELNLLSGNYLAGSNLKIGYFSQHQYDDLDLSASPMLHLQRLNPKLGEQASRNYLGTFGFSGDQSLTSVSTLSGGEKARLALALIAYQRPNLLLLDEPTNHLDLEMRHALIMALQQFAGALILVSHDRHLIRNCIDNFMLIHEQRLFDYDDGLDAYLKGLHKMPLTGVKAESRNQPNPYLRTKSLRSELAKIDRDLDRLRHRQKEIDERLSDPSLYQDHESADLKSLLRDKATHRLEVDELEERWIACAGELEGLSG